MQVRRDQITVKNISRKRARLVLGVLPTVSVWHQLQFENSYCRILMIQEGACVTTELPWDFSKKWSVCERMWWWNTLFSFIYSTLHIDTYLSFQFYVAFHMVRKTETVSEAVF